MKARTLTAIKPDISITLSWLEAEHLMGFLGMFSESNYEEYAEGSYIQSALYDLYCTLDNVINNGDEESER